MLKVNQLIGFGAGGAYRANAITYNGTTDYLAGPVGGWTAGPSSGQFIFAGSFRIDALASQFLFNSSGVLSADGEFQVYFNGSGNMILESDSNTPGTNQIQSTTVATYGVSASWVNVLASGDTNAMAGARTLHHYVNDADVKNLTADSGGLLVPNYANHTLSRIAADASNGQKFSGGVSDIYFAVGTMLDFSVEANRRKFFDASGKPVDKGSDGSLPTGTAPLIFLPNRAVTVGTNAGTGGNFTINGTPTDSATSPSD